MKAFDYYGKNSLVGKSSNYLLLIGQVSPMRITIGEVTVETPRSYKSFRYKTNLRWSSGRRGVLAALGKPDLPVASPPEFKGEPGIWCPEESLVGAVETCIMLTFLALAEGKHLNLVAYESNAEGVLEHKEGKYLFTQITVAPTLVLATESDLTVARELMAKSESLCFVSNSLKTQVHLEPQFRVGSSAA